MRRQMYYILENGIPVAAEDLREFGKWFENADRSIERTKVGDAEVSTVFLGINHRFGGEGKPVLFETMVFGGKHDQWQARYCTLGEAKTGHFRVVDALKEGREP